MAEVWQGPLNKIDDYRYEIPKSYKQGMRVSGIIYADDKLIKDIRHDKAAEQVANVAFLPGIVGHSMAMPDIHWGYGFPIGGVAATDPEQGGVVSPAGVGYDINCGVRLLRTNFQFDEIKDKIEDLTYALFNDVPSGVGSKGDIRVSAREEKNILVKGAQWAVENGFGAQEDLEATEEYGAIAGADPDEVSERALKRGKAQSGTLGSGNHFLEVQAVDTIFDKHIASEFGLYEGQVTIMIHSGSRGFGYQVCDDFVKDMVKCLSKYNITMPDRQLAAAPVNSPEGKSYIAAMRCAVNYAWANRQCLMHLTRTVFERVFRKSWRDMDMHLIYDVAHNVAKFEKHKVNGKEKMLCVHRKGATRAFPPGHPELPPKYQQTGQPVIIPGDMGRNSYLLVGTEQAAETFYSTCHGAGRLKSRTAATKAFDASWIIKDLKSKGIYVKASGRGTISEEAPGAYKDVNDVVNVVHNAGISKKVCRMRPLGVIKG
ncbi:RtcB family protein [Candidatus Omnitrophota bacterium]